MPQLVLAKCVTKKMKKTHWPFLLDEYVYSIYFQKFKSINESRRKIERKIETAFALENSVRKLYIKDIRFKSNKMKKKKTK